MQWILRDAWFHHKQISGINAVASKQELDKKMDPTLGSEKIQTTNRRVEIWVGKICF